MCLSFYKDLRIFLSELSRGIIGDFETKEHLLKCPLTNLTNLQYLGEYVSSVENFFILN